MVKCELLCPLSEDSWSGPSAGRILLDLNLKQMDSLVENRLGRPQWKSLRCGQLGSKPTTTRSQFKMVALWETIREDAAL